MSSIHNSPVLPLDVEAAFSAFPEPARSDLLKIRDLIFEVAASDPRIGPVSEYLKWGQPSYNTAESGSGTPIRLGRPKSGGFAVFTHCQTTVIPEFRETFGEAFAYDANRAVVFDKGTEIDLGKLAVLVSRALTYRL